MLYPGAVGEDGYLDAAQVGTIVADNMLKESQRLLPNTSGVQVSLGEGRPEGRTPKLQTSGSQDFQAQSDGSRAKTILLPCCVLLGRSTNMSA